MQRHGHLKFSGRHLGFGLDFVVAQNDIMGRCELLRFSVFQDGDRRVMAIFLFPKWRPAAILNFVKSENEVTARRGLSMPTTMPNLVTISQMAIELLRFSVFQNGGRTPSWILFYPQVTSRHAADCL